MSRDGGSEQLLAVRHGKDDGAKHGSSGGDTLNWVLDIKPDTIAIGIHKRSQAATPIIWSA
jgi:hypothetical protein